jgi:chloramphenicol O-acetyltransferase type A
VHAEYIDLETWDRKALFKTYLEADFPYILIGADVEVSQLYSFTRQNRISFYFAMVYAANEIANGIRNFRYRFAGGKPCLIDCNRPVITHLQPGSELFVLLEGEPAGDMVEFCRRLREKAQGAITIATTRGRNDVIIYSCIPWVRYTQLIRPIVKRDESCNPKISWGKFEKRGARLFLPFSLQVHHGLMDGYHVGLYFQRLQQYLNDSGWR